MKKTKINEKNSTIILIIEGLLTMVMIFILFFSGMYVISNMLNSNSILEVSFWFSMLIVLAKNIKFSLLTDLYEEIFFI